MNACSPSAADPGFEPAELATVVGEEGHVLGLDISDAMLAMAEGRCGDLSQVTLESGDAADLPVGDDAFDAAVSVQVYEHIDDVGRGISELERVLRPGGRAGVYPTDWDNFVWHSSNPDRMQRIVDSFTEVYANPHLGSQLTSHFLDAGLTIVHTEPNSILNTDFKDTFAGHVVDLLRGQAESDDSFKSSEIDAWERDLQSLDEVGETCLMNQLTYFIATAALALDRLLGV